MNAHGKWLTIDELAQQGKVPGNKIGNQWRFDREKIDQWIKPGDATSPKENL